MEMLKTRAREIIDDAVKTAETTKKEALLRSKRRIYQDKERTGKGDEGKTL